MLGKIRKFIEQQFAQLSMLESLIYAFVFLLSFLLPLSKVPVPAMIGILFILSVIRTIQQKGKYLQKPGLASLLLIGLYVGYIAGLSYSSDTARGLFDLEVKLSFLIIPVIFILAGKNIFTEKRIQTLKLVFVCGALISSLVNLLHGTYLSMNAYFTLDNYMYNRLSWGFHPSYAALYMNMAILILTLYLISQWDKLKISTKILFCFTILYFFVFVIFLNSKMGILMSGLTILLLLVYMVIKKRKFWLGLISLTMLILVTFIIMKWTPYISTRLVSSWQSFISYNQNGVHQNDGTTYRLQIWHYASQVAIKNSPAGVGTGDVKSELNAAYLENGFADGAAMNLNAHNQFLQTWIGIGLPGLCILALIFITLFISGIKNRNAYILIFTIMLLGNNLVESMLETQAGVIFTVFFICLFDMGERKNAKKIDEDLRKTLTGQTP
jgi:O-antigen ligase